MRIAVGCALAGLMMAGGALAQAPGAGYPQPGMRMPAPPAPPMAAPGSSPRWGSQVGGRWWGGMNAPGGYGAYRQPVRGQRVPSYWVAPRFHVSDWDRYGFAAPQQGYRWARYYNDAVLIDGRGQVFDSVGAVNWDGYEGGDTRREDGRDNGLGGAAIGAVAGGVAGNLIGGRGNRLGGTLIGAGVGAAAGYAIDKAEDDRRGPPRGAGYGVPMAGDYPPPPPRAGYDRRDGRTVLVRRGPGRSSWSSADGSTTVVTSGGGYPAGYGYGGYGYGGGYAYGGSVTTVTVESAPMVTTTTTEVIEDRVTYRPVYARRTYKAKRAWHPRGKEIRLR